MATSISTEEADLIDQSLTGDSAAIGRLFARLQKPLIGYLMTHARCTRMDAEDALQEVWAKLWAEFSNPASTDRYDPAKGGFYSFIINRYLKFAVRRHNELAANRRFITVSDEVSEDDAPQTISLPADDPSPEESVLASEAARLKSRAFAECFRITFAYGGYPHQVLAFGYSKLILGRGTKSKELSEVDGKRSRQVEGSPLKLDEMHGANALSQVARSFRSDFAEAAGLPDQALEPLFRHLEPLETALTREVKEISEGNQAFQSAHLDKLDRLVGNTCFREYYGSRGIQAIPDWCDKVRRRVMARLGIG